MTVAAVVVAAGRGERLGGDVPKAYRDLGGAPVLRRTLRAFLNHPAVTVVQTVIDPAQRDRYEAATQGLILPPPVAGGATRQASVRAGLEALATAPPQNVLIQDAARPLVSKALIDRVLEALSTAPGALPALPVVDSLRRVAAGRLAGEAEREGLVRAQTPQGFAYRGILDAHRRLHEGAFTDDAALAAAAGLEVAVVPGDEANVKITYPEDLELAQHRAAGAWRWRTGTGFDVHALKPGLPCLVGGVAIPHDRGLAGHSDADVGLHALTDAILGTVGAGDIGTHFPPSDPRWRGADSTVFLKEALRLLRAQDGHLEHVDLTVICERPKIGPHREAMRARIAEVLDLPVADVSVKATTTERLGFAGRGEGIAAQAAATARLPWRLP